MVAAAKTFRIPYWDWAAGPPAGQSIFPGSLWNSTAITVNGPAGVQTIANPLFDFQFKPMNTTELPDAPVSISIFQISRFREDYLNVIEGQEDEKLQHSKNRLFS